VYQSTPRTSWCRNDCAATRLGYVEVEVGVEVEVMVGVEVGVEVSDPKVVPEALVPELLAKRDAFGNWTEITP
jgi:hypothetical protein